MGIDVAAIYTVAEAAKAIAMSETFIREQIKIGALPAHRLGKRVLKIKGSDLQQWFDEQRIPSADTGSCPPSKDGSPSGIKTAAERGTASALRELRLRRR